MTINFEKYSGKMKVERRLTTSTALFCTECDHIAEGHDENGCLQEDCQCGIKYTGIQDCVFNSQKDIDNEKGGSFECSCGFTTTDSLLFARHVNQTKGKCRGAWKSKFCPYCSLRCLQSDCECTCHFGHKDDGTCECLTGGKK